MLAESKKIGLSAVVVLIFIAYSFQQRHDATSAVIAPSQPGSSSPTSIPISSEGADDSQTKAKPKAKSSALPATSTPATPAPAVSGYKDGSYTGSVADAYFGNVQVQVIIKSGKIADVQFLQYPKDQPTSVYINNQAMPYLKQETISAQNSNVNIITGATYTSQAFIQSLTAALSQA